jgi:GNAT superfamily N-acetyltransferase
MAVNHDSSNIFCRVDGLAYQVAGEEHGEAMAGLLAASFVHEPMNRALGLTTTELYEFVSRFIPECTANRLSVIAVSERSPDELAGVFISRDFKALLPLGVPDDFPRFEPIIDALMNVEEQYEAQVAGLQRGQAVNLWMVGVDGRFSRRGVAGNLFRISAQIAHDQGFERCVTECTGHFSQRAALDAGFQERACVLYKDFIFKGRPVFAAIPEPHFSVGLYERVLVAP